jgi:hypothetical protein
MQIKFKEGGFQKKPSLRINEEGVFKNPRGVLLLKSRAGGSGYT